MKMVYFELIAHRIQGKWMLRDFAECLDTQTGSSLPATAKRFTVVETDWQLKCNLLCKST
jgi:hypothetical protein